MRLLSISTTISMKIQKIYLSYIFDANVSMKFLVCHKFQTSLRCDMHLGTSSSDWQWPVAFQDPDLEAKRKAELEKIRSQKKKFKQRIQEDIQRQKHGQLKKKLRKRKQLKKKKAAQATVWKLLWPMCVYTTSFITVQYLIFSHLWASTKNVLNFIP